MEFNFIPKTLYLMRFFGLFPPKNQESTKFKDVVYISCLAFSLWFVLGGSYAYLYANIHTATVDIMTDNMYTNFIYQMMCSNYLLMSIGRFSIRDLINELEIIVTKRRICGQQSFYEEANKKSDVFLKRYTSYCFTGILGVIFIPFFVPFYHFVTNQYSFASWYTPYKFYLPHNSTYTPGGMIVVLAGQEIAAVLAVFLSAMYLSFYATNCLYIGACLSDVASIFKKVDQLCTETKSTSNRKQYESFFVELLDLHTWTINYRNRFVQTISVYVFLSIVHCVGALCTLLFQLQVSAENFSPEIYQAFGIGSLMLLFLFIFCYYGEFATERSENVAIAAYMSEWYLYPLEIQKFLSMTVVYSKITFSVSPLGIMYCNMEKFTSLVKTAVSFFMLFRNVA